MIDELEMRLLHEADHPACNRDIWPEDLLREAAADIVVKKAAIAESARMIHKLMTRALAAEACLAEARSILEFYADEANWQSPSRGFALQYDPEPSAFQKDRGSAARSFLNSASNKEGAASAQQESSDADQ